MKKKTKANILAIGTSLTDELTVLGHVDSGAADPVYIVWNHKTWCPMVCKHFASPYLAKIEAERLRSLSHPNIVRCLGLVQPGCLLMPFLAGPTLASLVDTSSKGCVPVNEALRIAVHIASALHYMHGEGLLHMDVKPDNIIVTPGGVPVLFDLGIARRRDEVRPNRVIGTSEYIAPEECNLQDVGPAADVFGFGVLLYEMLTGQLPYGKGTKAAPYPQTKRIPKPMREHKASIPAAIENLVFACLERDPTSRSTLDELILQLNRLIRSGPRMWPAGFNPSRRPRQTRTQVNSRIQPSKDDAEAEPVVLLETGAGRYRLDRQLDTR